MGRTKQTGGTYKPRSTPGHAPVIAAPAPASTPVYVPRATPGHAPVFNDSDAPTAGAYDTLVRMREQFGPDRDGED